MDLLVEKSQNSVGNYFTNEITDGSHPSVIHVSVIKNSYIIDGYWFPLVMLLIIPMEKSVGIIKKKIDNISVKNRQ